MITIDYVESIHEVDAASWDALVNGNDPFTEHAFFALLEESGSVGPRETGWEPHHVIVRDGERIVGALPLYVKTQSYGEYIFDWQWAEVSQRSGIPYYPKLVSAVPFTPATGRRLLVHPEAPWEEVVDALLAGAKHAANRVGAWSIHVLFCTEAEQEALAERGFLSRSSLQFHWTREDGWGDFEDYIGAFRAKARKQVRRERRIARESGAVLEMQDASALSDEDWDAVANAYYDTAERKWGRPYLNRRFWALMNARLGDRIQVATARVDGKVIASALFFARGTHLYGRYWGGCAPTEMLHFELCYYLPIEWALERGYTRFEAGAQGTHKLKRGLMPSRCASSHWLRHKGLSDAVQRFLTTEDEEIRSTISRLAGHGPFRCD